jgi:hypothetical protein
MGVEIAMEILSKTNEISKKKKWDFLLLWRWKHSLLVTVSREKIQSFDCFLVLGVPSKLDDIHRHSGYKTRTSSKQFLNCKII